MHEMGKKLNSIMVVWIQLKFWWMIAMGLGILAPPLHTKHKSTAARP